MLPVKFDVQKTYFLYFFIVGMIQVDLFNWFDAYVYLFRSDFIRQIMHSAWEQCKVMYSSFFSKIDILQHYLECLLRLGLMMTHNTDDAVLS